jgi:alkylation response protein AidB-like acyl-CoA dehydrogenase
MTRRWLAAELPAGWMEAVDNDDPETLARLRQGLDYSDWCIRLGEAGYATPTWPSEYGAGLSLSPGDARHVNEVLSHYKIPRPFNIIGIGMGGPTVMAWGTEEMKHRLLRPLACNQEIWCQLFSEPGAGSDVAGLATRAVRDGDEWIVNGQKVWTTVAHLAKWGMLLARTNPDVPKHDGLSYFLLDMHAPGVEVRPLYQITGEAEFNEVFLNDVRIPQRHMLGREGEGWRVAITTLMNERVAIGSGGSRRKGGGSIGQVVKLWQARPRGARTPAQEAILRDRLTRCWIDAELMRITAQRARAAQKAGNPGPEGSVSKLAGAEANMRLWETALDVIGSDALAFEAGYALRQSAPRSDTPESLAKYQFLRSRANSIEGGTSEIMRNILGERVLGLPGEPRVDKDVAWKDVPRS